MNALTPIQIETADPFLITGPAVISFSGGRTSAYMLWRIIQAYGGTLPDDVVVCFANTGREMPATLDFVRDCGAAWGVKVHWLEYRYGDNSQEQTAVEVDYETASRSGEPFDAVLRRRAFLPNGRSLFCSGELKTRTVRRFIVSEYGWSAWAQAIGLRWDEENRVRKIFARADRDAEQRGVVFPLHSAGVTSADVLAFWAAQPFDLMLTGKWEGNCDGCFRKRKTAIARMFRDHPERMDWWPQKEAEMAGKTREASGALFRLDWKGGYAGVRKMEFDQGRLDLAADDDGMDVFNPCDGGCGV